MNIFYRQLRRILGAPFFLFLLAAFLLWNGFLISQKMPMQREINLINDIAGQTGIHINADFHQKFQKIADASEADLRTLYQAKTKQAPADDQKMLYALTETGLPLTGSEQDRVRDISATLNLGSAVQNHAEIYNGFDMNKRGTYFLKEVGADATLTSFLKPNYAKLQQRVEQIRQDGEMDTLFFPGTTYAMHSFLYNTLFKSILMESAILGVLVMLYSVSFEFMHGTQALTYTTQRGRMLTLDQFGASLFTGLLVPLFLLGVTLPVYFSKFHYSNLWDSIVSCSMNAERSVTGIVPYVTWEPMTMRQYLWTSIAILFGLQVIFCLFAFVTAVLCRNSYIGFLGYALVSMALLALPSMISPRSLPAYLTACNPIAAWYSCGTWLTQVGSAAVYPQYIPAILCCWGLLSVVLITFSLRHFRRRDL